MPEYRPAAPHELPVITKLAHEIWPLVYREMISGEQIAYMLAWMYSPESLQQQVQEGAIFWLAMEGEKPVGFASAQETETGQFKLHKLYVHPDLHGRGLGKGLLDTVLHFARENGGKRIELQVNRGNPARFFYEKNGFRILRSADFEIGGGYQMNDYIMEKNLQAHS